jgi:hypothetical protein
MDAAKTTVAIHLIRSWIMGSLLARLLRGRHLVYRPPVS